MILGWKAFSLWKDTSPLGYSRELSCQYSPPGFTGFFFTRERFRNYQNSWMIGEAEILYSYSFSLKGQEYWEDREESLSSQQGYIAFSHIDEQDSNGKRFGFGYS